MSYRPCLLLKVYTYIGLGSRACCSRQEYAKDVAHAEGVFQTFERRPSAYNDSIVLSTCYTLLGGAGGLVSIRL